MSEDYKKLVNEISPHLSSKEKANIDRLLQDPTIQSGVRKVVKAGNNVDTAIEAEHSTQRIAAQTILGNDHAFYSLPEYMQVELTKYVNTETSFGRKSQEKGHLPSIEDLVSLKSYVSLAYSKMSTDEQERAIRYTERMIVDHIITGNSLPSEIPVNTAALNSKENLVAKAIDAKDTALEDLKKIERHALGALHVKADDKDNIIYHANLPIGRNWDEVSAASLGDEGSAKVKAEIAKLHTDGVDFGGTPHPGGHVGSHKPSGHKK